MLIFKNINDIKGVSTAHGIGVKQVLLSNGDTDSAVTQIAVTTLRAGDEVKPHMHKIMDEHYFILNGEGIMFICNKQYPIEYGTYLLIAAGEEHSLRALTNLQMITIGIAYDK